MYPRLRIIVIGLVVIAAVAIGYRIFRAAGDQRQRLDQLDFYEAVAEGQVEEVIITLSTSDYLRGPEVEKREFRSEASW